MKKIVTCLLLICCAWGELLMAQRLTVRTTQDEMLEFQLADDAQSRAEHVPYGMLFGLSGVDKKNNQPILLTLENTQSFRLGKLRLEQVSFTYEGEQVRAFLQLLYSQPEGMRVYRFYTSPDEYADLVQMNAEAEVLPLRDDPARGIASPLRQMLYSYPVASDPDVRAYIDALPAKHGKLLDAVPMLETGKASRLLRFKWGVTAGVWCMTLRSKRYDVDMRPMATMGIWADLPWSEFSIHPELIVGKFAANGKMSQNADMPNSVAYNQTFVGLPLLLRYNMRYLTGMAVPYLEMGAQLDYSLKNKVEFRYMSVYDGAIDLHQGSEELKQLTTDLVAGVGCEWQFKKRHSVYTALRFNAGMGNQGRMGASLSVSYNL